MASAYRLGRHLIKAGFKRTGWACSTCERDFPLLILGFCFLHRPDNLPLLTRIVKQEVVREIGLALNPVQSPDEEPMTPAPPRVVPDPSRLPKVTQWTLRRKNWLDRHLEMEMRADEASWMAYRTYERAVLQNILPQIFWELFDEVYENCRRTIRRQEAEERDRRRIREAQRLMTTTSATTNNAAVEISPPRPSQLTRLPPLQGRTRNPSSISETTGGAAAATNSVAGGAKRY